MTSPRVSLTPGTVRPWTPELRSHDDVVVKRPQRRVAEALVIIPGLCRGHAHADQVHAVGIERSRRRARSALPANTCLASRVHHRLEGRNQAAGTGLQGALHDFSAAGWVGEEREKSRPAALGHLDAPPMTDERAEDSHGACERHAQAKIMVGQFAGQAVRRGEAP